MCRAYRIEDGFSTRHLAQIFLFTRVSLHLLAMKRGFSCRSLYLAHVSPWFRAGTTRITILKPGVALINLEVPYAFLPTSFIVPLLDVVIISLPLWLSPSHIQSRQCTTLAKLLPIMFSWLPLVAYGRLSSSSPSH